METGNGISEGRADYKVPGGKLIRVRVQYSDSIIEKVRFYGDFFIHPEEAVEELENRLAGKDIPYAEQMIDDFFEDVDAAGISSEDFKKALNLAIKGKAE